MTRIEESFQIRGFSYFSVCFLHVAALGAVRFSASSAQLVTGLVCPTLKILAELQRK